MHWCSMTAAEQRDDALQAVGEQGRAAGATDKRAESEPVRTRHEQLEEEFRYAWHIHALASAYDI